MKFSPDEKTILKEKASLESRHWVRLTSICNNNCIFCLDKDSQDSGILSFDSIVSDMKNGIEKGCSKVILSGGEASLHPRFTDVVRAAKTLGYERTQIVTNGRMFAYRDFLDASAAAGLDELTFSIHGHTPDLHDSLTQIPGSFRQTVAGLMNALDHGGLIVNIDIVINKMNYRLVHEIMRHFIRLGVREFDLLHVTPFGAAWKNRKNIFYDPASGAASLGDAFALSRRKDLFVWTNRFPARYLTEFPELIQNPVKLKDEVRGRMDIFDGFLGEGRRFPCKGARCGYCFLSSLCSELFIAKKTLDASSATAVRTSVSSLPSVGRISRTSGGPRLMIIHGDSIQNLLRAAGSVPQSCRELLLDFEDCSGAELLKNTFPSIKVSISADSPSMAEHLAAINGITTFIEINNETAGFIEANAADLIRRGSRLTMKHYPILEETFRNSVDASVFFRKKRIRNFRTLGVPGCLVNTPPRKLPRFIDSSFLTPQGGIGIYPFVDYFIERRYYVYPYECEKCAKKNSCPGLHVNYLRARGFRPRPFRNNKLK